MLRYLLMQQFFLGRKAGGAPWLTGLLIILRVAIIKNIPRYGPLL
jgi:hypothetical protein